MAKVNERVFAAVEATLKKNPKATVDDLYDMAKGLSGSIGRLSKRQFHARYPLQIKRRANVRKAKPSAPKKAPVTRRRPAAKASPTGNRDGVREAFLKFASDLAAADSRKDLVKVLASVDKYVDQVLKVAGAG